MNPRDLAVHLISSEADSAALAPLPVTSRWWLSTARSAAQDTAPGRDAEKGQVGDPASGFGLPTPHCQGSRVGSGSRLELPRTCFAIPRNVSAPDPGTRLATRTNDNKEWGKTVPERRARSPFPRGRERLTRELSAGALLVGAAAVGSLLSSLVTTTASAASDQVVSAGLVEVGSAAVVPAGAHAIGSVSTSSPITVGVALDSQDPTGLAAYAAGVADASSPDYHRYLTPSQFAARFGPAPAAIAAVQTSLRSQGLAVGAPSANGLMLTVKGTAGRIEGAFHTELTRYRLAGGQSGWSASTAPRLPASLGSSVSAVLGLDNLAIPHALVAHPALTRRTAQQARAPVAAATSITKVAAATSTKKTAAPVACAAAKLAASNGGGWTDSQLAGAYGLTGLYRAGDLARGQTIAMFELEPYSSRDLAAFNRCYFGTSHAGQISVVPVDGFALRGTGSGEALLDLEDVSALAPDAKIVVYQAPNTTFGGVDAYNAMVSEDRASIISTSWGECESALQTGAPGVQQLENVIFEEAAAQGQTVFAAAGDTGSDDCASTPFSTSTPAPPYLSVDDPASQPYVVGVGGTSLATVTDPASETVWDDGAKWGSGGGGISNVWPSPAWQSGSGIPGVQQSRGRQVPDVSAAADEWRGVTVFSALFGASPGSVRARLSTAGPPPGWTTLGGTSSAAPIWAAVAAEIAASPACAALPV
ncbi:MAG: putative cell wall binding repeat 2-containing protein, partial [Acidimicrobiaceae bacterium]|nr:putative cell wall binding repeat 2-containing protein [Acidimicrobiaceae bacterium]